MIIFPEIVKSGKKHKVTKPRALITEVFDCEGEKVNMAVTDRSVMRSHCNLNLSKGFRDDISRGFIHSRVIQSMTSEGPIWTLEMSKTPRYGTIKIQSKKVGGLIKYTNHKIFKSLPFEDGSHWKASILDSSNDCFVFKIQIYDHTSFRDDGRVFSVSALKGSDRVDQYDSSMISRLDGSNDFKNYRRQVDLLTAKVSDSLVKGCRKIGDHKDHIYSVHQAFIDGWTVYMVSHYSNLQWLSESENTSKGSRCDRTLQEAILEFNKHDIPNSERIASMDLWRNIK